MDKYLRINPKKVINSDQNMKQQQTITILIAVIIVLSGIAQDVVTLFIGIPLLMIALLYYRRGSVKAHFLLTGVVGYFFVTYLFYMTMGTYNKLFLVYAALMGLTFFSLFNLFLSFNLKTVSGYFSDKAPAKFTGGFLVFNSVAIALMWLGRVVPPLLDGSIYLVDLQHYTTMIVQGFDLGLLLPVSFVAGILLVRKKPMGYLTAVPYIVFLSILMTALSAKIIAMGISEVNIIPEVFIIQTQKL
jgi:hypothetical protein